MPITNPQYDVALSFLSADESIAAALNSALSAGLEVFFFPRKQEALAGTDGLESMRTPFLEDSRVVVVLFRELWGNTPWTGVEQTAIKARVQDSGGVIAPLSAMRRAQLSQQEQQYLRERQQFRSPWGRDSVHQEATDLFGKINQLCTEIADSGTVSIQFASDPWQCHLRNERVSLIVTLSQTHSATLSDTSSEFELKVREFSKRLAFQGENLMYMNGQPKQLTEITFLPELSRAGERCWTKADSPSRFVSSDALANEILIQFINLSDRRR